MIVDFKMKKDEFGYYVVAYRIKDGVEIVFETNQTISALLNLLPEEYIEFIKFKFKSDEDPKNRKMHFSNIDDADECLKELRELIPLAIETNNLFLAE